MRKEPQPPPQLELIPKTVAEKLDNHAKSIRTYIKGHRKGSAEAFGYAFLAGRAMLLAKEVIPHGHSHSPNAGLKHWAEANFRNLPYRTLTHWMQFATAISDHLKSGSIATLKEKPLMLSNGKINSQDRSLILDLIPRVMDGKGMLAFMRSSSLLRDPLQPKPAARKPVPPDQALAAKKKQAERLWTTILGDLDLGVPLAQHLPDDTRFSTARELAKHIPPLTLGLPKKLTDELAGLLADTASLVRTQSPASPIKKARP